MDSMYWAAAPLQKAIVAGLKKRLGFEAIHPDLTDLMQDKILVLSTLLNPFYKNSMFDPEDQPTCKDILTQAVKETIKSLNEENQPLSEHSADSIEDDDDPFERFEKTINVPSSSSQITSPPILDENLHAIAEVEDYLARQKESKKTSSFANSGCFWNDPINSAKYPHLKILVKKYHSAPATSAESERVFSSVKLALGDLRKSVSPDNLEKQLFIRHNTMILGFD